MPIHTSWKSMAKGMKKTYCKKGDKNVARDFTDGAKVSLCSKAWSVFFGTVSKLVGKGGEKKPRPAKVNETVFNETVPIYLNDLVNWAVKDKELP